MDLASVSPAYAYVCSLEPFFSIQATPHFHQYTIDIVSSCYYKGFFVLRYQLSYLASWPGALLPEVSHISCISTFLVDPVSEVSKSRSTEWFFDFALFRRICAPRTKQTPGIVQTRMTSVLSLSLLRILFINVTWLIFVLTVLLRVNLYEQKTLF